MGYAHCGAIIGFLKKQGVTRCPFNFQEVNFGVSTLISGCKD